MSDALQPHLSVASKNGDLRYHGPKYRPVDAASGMVAVSELMPAVLFRSPLALSSGSLWPSRCWLAALLNDRSISAIPQAGRDESGQLSITGSVSNPRSNSVSRRTGSPAGAIRGNLPNSRGHATAPSGLASPAPMR